ncbi:unnamed protein product, partial [Discosporangium mesarthrocarpum]
GCFDAVSADGHLYSINLLTGTVLFDGFPPSLLPSEVVEHPLYVRNFGGMNMEIAATGGGEPAACRVLKTACATRGRFYEFFMHDGDLVIHEEDTTRGGIRLQLLKNDGDWAKDLPVRLRHMHSHWLCRDLDVVVLRPVGFQQRETDFVIHLAKSGEATCVRIPTHRRSQHWLDLLPSSDSNKLVLVKGRNRVLQVLSKFESPAAGPGALVHAYLRPSGGLVFDMPRF